MERRTNALAELAEELTSEKVYRIDGKAFGYVYLDSLVKAQRIVAELAKADKTYADDCVHNSIVDLAYEALKNCRAIAEEGESNDY